MPDETLETEMSEDGDPDRSNAHGKPEVSSKLSRKCL